MSEAILLICMIAIVAPVLVLVVIAYNINQRLKGLPEKDGADALLDIWKNLFNKLKNPETKKLKKTAASEMKKSVIEDAEFYEKKS